MKPDLQDLDLATLNKEEEEKLREMEEAFNRQVNGSQNHEIYLLAFLRKT